MPVVAWPAPLLDRIVADRWVLFLGSGVSATCRNNEGEHPPTWTDLLSRLCGLISDTRLRRIGEELIREHDLLSAADHVRYSLAHEDNLTGYEQAIRSAVEGPPADRYVPSRFFSYLLRLEPRVVFTTNYDSLFQQASKNGFRDHSFSSQSLGHELRRGEPVFVRLHGSTDAVSDIILTRTDYARIARDGREVFGILRALALTSTIFFVGYSLDDPDIHLVMQAISRPGSTSPEAHFLLTRKPASASRVAVFKESFGVSVLTYTGAHTRAATAMKELARQVEEARAAAA